MHEGGGENGDLRLREGIFGRPIADGMRHSTKDFGEVSIIRPAAVQIRGAGSEKDERAEIKHRVEVLLTSDPKSSLRHLSCRCWSASSMKRGFSRNFRYG